MAALDALIASGLLFGVRWSLTRSRRGHGTVRDVRVPEGGSATVL